MDSKDFKEAVSTVTRLCMECLERKRFQNNSLIFGLGNLEDSDAINQRIQE